MTFSRLGEEILEAIGVDSDEASTSHETKTTAEVSAKPFGIGGHAEVARTDGKESLGVARRTIDPLLLFRHLKQKNAKYVIVLDEYDAISPGDGEFHASLAYLMKILADHSDECDSRLVIVGVAQSSKDLLGRHASIERSAREIYLNPLRHQDVHDFLSEAERRLKTAFGDRIKDEIARDSAGYPYYVHLVGLECHDAMSARDEHAKQITEADYQRAIVRAIQHAFRSELRKYRGAIRGMSEKEWILIRELAALPQRPPRKELEERLSNRRLMSPQEFDHAWVRLQQERRFLYVSRHDDTVRFADPLMWAFLRGWILRRPTEDRSQLLEDEEDPPWPTAN
jgi:hypothetical protein